MIVFIMFIADRTATHPEARLDHVKDCPRTQCERAKPTMNWFERTCLRDNCAERPTTGLERTETYGQRVKREQDELKFVKNALQTTLSVTSFSSKRCTSVVQTVCNRNALIFKLCCVVVIVKIARFNPSSSRFMKFSEQAETFFELVKCERCIM